MADWSIHEPNQSDALGPAGRWSRFGRGIRRTGIWAMGFHGRNMHRSSGLVPMMIDQKRQNRYWKTLNRPLTDTHWDWAALVSFSCYGLSGLVSMLLGHGIAWTQGAALILAGATAVTMLRKRQRG